MSFQFGFCIDDADGAETAAPEASVPEASEVYAQKGHECSWDSLVRVTSDTSASSCRTNFRFLRSVCHKRHSP